MGWRPSALALKVGRLGPNPSPATHQPSGRDWTGWQLMFQKALEKIKRNGAAGGGHSLGISLEDRPGH